MHWKILVRGRKLQIFITRQKHHTENLLFPQRVMFYLMLYYFFMFFFGFSKQKCVINSDNTFAITKFKLILNRYLGQNKNITTKIMCFPREPCFLFCFIKLYIKQKVFFVLFWQFFLAVFGLFSYGLSSSTLRFSIHIFNMLTKKYKMTQSLCILNIYFCQ